MFSATASGKLGHEISHDPSPNDREINLAYFDDKKHNTPKKTNIYEHLSIHYLLFEISKLFVNGPTIST